MRQCKLLIVGAGPAGITAALSAWHAGCREIILVDKAEHPGGVLLQCFHEGFSLPPYNLDLTGPVYAEKLVERLESTDIQLLLNSEVLQITPNKTALLSRCDGMLCLKFERMILATGCRERSIWSLPVAGTRPAGIFTAGQAQEIINIRRKKPGNEVLILGSGDLGMIVARCFIMAGSHVIAVVEQQACYTGMARNYHRCIEAFQVPMIFQTTISEIHGAKRLCGVTLRNLDSGEEKNVPCDTLITALGLIPERELVRTLGQPEWLFFAGNCNHVHSLVGSAIAEAEQIGKLTVI